MLLGMITATFGGLKRDVLCNEIPMIFRIKIYFRKEEFVEMYNEQVAPVADDAGEFSSDDEVDRY